MLHQWQSYNTSSQLVPGNKSAKTRHSISIHQHEIRTQVAERRESTWTLSASWSSRSATGTAPAGARGAPAEGRSTMAVGGALGIAVGADAPAAAVVAGGGGSNPGTSQDQRPRVSAIGAAAAGNPRSRRGFGGGEREAGPGRSRR